MTSTDPRPDIVESLSGEPASDAALLQAVRDGSHGAFGVLYARHRDHAVALARQALSVSHASHAEDVAEVALSRIFTALRNGKGPTDTLRYYLSTTVRREAWRVQRRQRRQIELLDHWTADERAVAATSPGGSDGGDVDADGSVDEELDKHVLLAEAFGGLPDRWRNVLWLTEVEGRSAAEVAPMLDLSANSLAALSYRARRGLAAAYVKTYNDRRRDPECKAVSVRLAQYVAEGQPRTGYDDVRDHLEVCSACRDLARGVDVAAIALLGAIPVATLSPGRWAADATKTAALAPPLAREADPDAADTDEAGSRWLPARRRPARFISAAMAVAAAFVITTVGTTAYAPSDPSGARAREPFGQRASASEPDGAATDPTGTKVEHETEDRTGNGSRSDQRAPAADRIAGASDGAQTGAGDPPSASTSPMAPSTPSTPAAGTASVSGQIVSAGGTASFATAGLPVTIVGIGGRVRGVASTRTDGSWQFQGLPPGTYSLEAQIPSDLAPVGGPEADADGSSWTAHLGDVELDGSPQQLPTLVLQQR